MSEAAYWSCQLSHLLNRVKIPAPIIMSNKSYTNGWLANETNEVFPERNGGISSWMFSKTSLSVHFFP